MSIFPLIQSPKSIGTPIREAFVLDHPPTRSLKRLAHLLIFGGSQGAQAINSAVLEAFERSEILREIGHADSSNRSQ